LVFLIIIIGLLGGAYYLRPRFESEAPQIKLTPDSDVLGLAPMEIGLRSGADWKSVTATPVGGSGTPVSSSTPSRLARRKSPSPCRRNLPASKKDRGPARQRGTARCSFAAMRPDREKSTIDITGPKSSHR
jgi:hypothetical protein